MAELVREPIDLERAVRPVESPAAGALLTFSGLVRNRHRGRTVTAIEYHAYDAMALRQLNRIEEEARWRWPEVRIHLVHRLGRLEIGETSVAIAVSSPHRAEGFEALRFAIEEVKKAAPIWKKEMYPDGYEWIEGS